MHLFAGKTVPWIIGIVALLSLGGLIAAMGLTGWTDPAGAPGLVKSLAPGFADQTEPAPTDARPAPGNFAASLRANAALAGPDTIVQGIDTFQPQNTAVTPTAVSIAPLEDWNPIRSQHTFTITVQDENGNPADGAEVEIILNRFGAAVGDIVSLDGNNPRKVDNAFGRVMTDANGEATLTITATRPGDTDVTAYVPQIADADSHKVFAVKHWVDMQAEFPGDDVNLVGTDHPMAVRVFRVSDGSPLADVEVLYTILEDNPDGSLNGSGNSVSLRTGDDGVAEAVLRQVTPQTGDNQVSIAVIHESGDALFNRVITKEWRAPSLEVDKQGPDNLGLFKQSDYTVTVTNSGNRVASAVTLTDALPAGLSLVSSTPAPDRASATSATWDLGDLQPGDSVTITMTLSATVIGNQVNRATAISSEGFTGEDDTTTAVIPGSLSLTKTAPTQVDLGDALTYNISLSNNGQGSLTNLVVTDTLPDGVSLASAPGATSGAAVPVQWSIARLDPGDSQSFTVNATAQSTGDQTNSVAVTSAEGATASANAVTKVVASDVSVAKSVNAAEVILGESLTYTITVTNNGDGDATNVRVVDIIPNGLTVTASDPAADTDADGNLLWTIASLAAGASTSFTVSGDTASPGLITNVSQVTDRGRTLNAEVQSTALTPGISLAKTGSAAVYIGGERTYTITATNSGEAPLSGVTITDTIPAGLTYVSSDSNGSRSGNTVTWSVGDLAVNESAAVTVTLRGVTAGQVTNQARVTTDQNADADATLDITVLATPGAHLSIVDTSDPLAVGEEGGYTITVENQSADSPITNVLVTVVVPTELDILAAEGGTISNNQVSYAAISSLAAGQTQTFTISVRANAANDVVASATMNYDEFSQSITSQEGTTIIER